MNPGFRYSYFPKCGQDRVTVCCIYDERLERKPIVPKSLKEYKTAYECLEKCEFEDLRLIDKVDKNYEFNREYFDKLCGELKEKLELKLLPDISCTCGQWALDMGIEDLPKVYQVFDYIIRVHRDRIFVNDTTQITLDMNSLLVADHFEGATLAMVHELKILLKFFTIDRWIIDMYLSFPHHRDSAWSTEEGKKFAKQEREKLGLSNDRNDKECFMGELL